MKSLTTLWRKLLLANGDSLINKQYFAEWNARNKTAIVCLGCRSICSTNKLFFQ